MPAAGMRDALRDATGGELTQIEARAEMIALAGEHDGLDRVRQGGKERLDAEHGRIVDGVALFRARKKENGDVVAALGPERAWQLHVEAAGGFAHGDPRSSKVSRAFGDISPKTGQALTPPHRRRAGPRASRARRFRAPESG